MATILTKKSDTASAVPVAGDLTNSSGGAELAVNTADKRLFAKNSGGTVVELGTNPTVIQVDNININGNAITSTNANGNIDLTPNGTGEVNITKVDIDSGAIDGTAIGASSASTGAFTTLSASSTVTLSGGTANGVLYLDGSKVATSGSALTFDGTTLTGTASGALAANFNRTTSSGATVKVQVVGNDVGTLGSSTDGQGCFDVAATTSLYLRATGTSGNFIRFDANNSEQMRLTSTGLGIGTSSPSEKLEVVGNYIKVTGTTNQVALRASNTGGDAYFGIDNSAGSNFNTGTAYAGVIWRSGANPICFVNNSTERMRIDSSGNVGIGTSSPVSRLDVQVGSGDDAANSTITIRSGGGSQRLDFYNNFSTASGVRARIESDGEGISNQYGTLKFFTTQNNTVGVNERMRIDSSGNVGIGTTSPSYKLQVQMPSSGIGASFRYTGGTNNPGLFFSVDESTTVSTIDASGSTSGILAFDTSGVERARIDSSGNLLIGYTSSNGAYLLQVNSQIFATNATIATSDGRYKENIQSLDGALNLVSQLNPVQFSWKEHPVHNFDLSGPTIGFIAQEVEQVLADKPYLNSIIKRNECVIEPEEKDAEGNVTKEAVTEEFLGIAEGNMIALLTKALQELKADFDAYKASHP